MTDEDAIIEQAWTAFRDTQGVKADGLVYVAFKQSVAAALAAVREESRAELEAYKRMYERERYVQKVERAD